MQCPEFIIFYLTLALYTVLLERFVSIKHIFICEHLSLCNNKIAKPTSYMYMYMHYPCQNAMVIAKGHIFFTDLAHLQKFFTHKIFQ